MSTCLKPLSETFCAKLTLPKLIDIEPLIISLMDSYAWTEMEARQVSQNYLRFLSLLQFYPDRLLVPTQDIDRVWHCHILHTRQYRQDCQTIFGHYLDHDPKLNLRMSRRSLFEVYRKTKNLFEQHFGVGSFDGNCNFSAACDCPIACGRPIAS